MAETRRKWESRIAALTSVYYSMLKTTSIATLNEHELVSAKVKKVTNYFENFLKAT